MTSSTACFVIPRSKTPRNIMQVQRINPVRTSNVQIFPSLHPLSNFYKAKEQTTRVTAFPTPAITESKPIKKVKMNHNTERLARDREKADKPPDIDDDKQKELVMQDLADYNNLLFSKKLVTRRPKQKKTQTYNTVQQFEAGHYYNGFTSSQQPLVMKDRFFCNNTPFFQLQNLQFDYTTLNNKFNNVNQEISIPGNHNLNFDQLSLQLKQNMPYLFRICQDNQEKLSKALQDPLVNNSGYINQEDFTQPKMECIFKKEMDQDLMKYETIKVESGY